MKQNIIIGLLVLIAAILLYALIFPKTIHYKVEVSHGARTSITDTELCTSMQETTKNAKKIHGPIGATLRQQTESAEWQADMRRYCDQ
jgi:hypothetical protein